MINQSKITTDLVLLKIFKEPVIQGRLFELFFDFLKTVDQGFKFWFFDT
jgi:hypothetical protein